MPALKKRREPPPAATVLMSNCGAWIVTPEPIVTDSVTPSHSAPTGSGLYVQAAGPDITHLLVTLLDAACGSLSTRQSLVFRPSLYKGNLLRIL